MSVHPVHRSPAVPAGVDAVAQLERVLRGLTTALVVVAVGCLAFTATNVTEFALEHGVSRWIAWLLDPLVAGALGTVLVVDGLLSEHDVRPAGAASLLRWFAGLATWFMNCWGSLWPSGTPFGRPDHLDPAGLLLHSVLPVLLIMLAEAITAYRRQIVARIAQLEAVDTPAPRPVRPTPERPMVEPEPEPVLVPEYQPEPVYRQPEPEPELEPVSEGLSAEQAAAVIEQCWREGVLSIRKTAELADRSKSFVDKCFAGLVEQYGPRPEPQQMALSGVAA
ncbi:hypothetical protein [Streptomyces platensis]|uniref:hypothetical protein n=1 Tax=Streptomyces platensis TaxID=58346 RepID=UPI0037B5A8BB